MISFITVILLIVTGVLIGIGFYGAYKAGGGAMGVVGLIFSIIGFILGSLFIILANVFSEVSFILPFLPPLIAPSFIYMWIGFIIIGIALIIIGSASIAVREVTARSSACSAAGILSIICAVLYIIGGLIFPGLIIFGSILLFVAFILWSVVFYSSREL